MKQQKPRVPRPVVRRLTMYLAHVQELREEGVRWASSHEIAHALGLTSSTVRQDLSHVDFSGISKRGYETEGLERTLVKVLGADARVNMVVVGAGNLGRALAMHEDFPRRGFTICGIFDRSPKVIGRRIGAIIVTGMDELPGVVRRKKAEIGLITAPASSAQGVADQLVAAGVRGLLNFACAHIRAPKHVAVVDARVVASLWELWHTMKG